MPSLTHIRKVSLVFAEAFDAWRVVPRAILVAYGWMVWMVSTWYMSIPSANETQCQADVLTAMMDRGVPVEQVRSMACTIVETIGGPTSEQTMFVSIVTGLSSVVIGLYLNSGKTSKWQGGVIDTIHPTNTLAGTPGYGRSEAAPTYPAEDHGYHPPADHTDVRTGDMVQDPDPRDRG